MRDTYPGRGERFSDDPAFFALEAAYGEFRDAWGRWMVGHHRGARVDQNDIDEATLVARLVASRRRLGELLERFGTSGRALLPADEAALANVRASLPDLDAWASPLDDVVRAGGVSAGSEPLEDLETADLRRRLFDDWGVAMADLRVGGERLHRLTAVERLARLKDPAERREVFLSMRPAWELVGGDGGPDSPYRRLVRSSAASWRSHGSPIERNAAGLGLDPAAVEPTMREILRTWRRVAMPSHLVEPWDYRFHYGALSRKLDPLLPFGRLREINDAHLTALGADPAALRIEYDIEPHPGRPVIPTAFTVSLDIARRVPDGEWRPARPWIFSTYLEGSLGNLDELLHESGHALHYAAVRARPAHFELPPEGAAFAEAFADVVAWSVTEPAFLAAHLGVAVDPREALRQRFGGVMLDVCWTLFELELHRHPERPPNDVWAEIVEDGLGVVGHPEWAWWAHRGQLIDGPGYLANYALGAILVAAVRSRIRELRGDWSAGDPGWYAFVSGRLLRWSGARPTATVVRELLGGPLTAEAMLAELDRAD